MLAKGLGPVEWGGVSGVFPSWRWSRLIRLHPCPVLITPPEEGWREKEKATAREPDLTSMAGSGSNGDHAVGHPKFTPASAAETAHAPAPGTAGSLINLG